MKWTESPVWALSEITVERKDCPVAMYKEVHWLYGFPRVLCFLMRLIIFLTCEEIPPLSWMPFRNLKGAILERDQWQWILSWGCNFFSDEDRKSSIHCFETIRNKFRVLVAFLKAVAKSHDLRVPSALLVKIWHRECELAGCIVSASKKKQCNGCCYSALSSSLFSQSGMLVLRVLSPCFQWAISP